MRINNSFDAVNSAYDKLKSTYGTNENSLSDMMHEALKDSGAITFIEDEVTVENEKKTDNAFDMEWWFEQLQENLEKQEESNELNSVLYKLYSGQELSTEEMLMLQKKSPDLYRLACEARQMKKDLERQARSCKSKEEVDRLKLNAVQSVAYRCGSQTGNSIPQGQETRASVLFGTVNKFFAEFMGSDEYNKLPDKTEKEKELEKSGQRINTYI